ncbi:unnamed protein product [Lota lota]
MSQKNPSDGGQKGFAVGRGLLAAAETLNFSMNEQRSGPQGRPMGNMVSGMGLGSGSGVDSQDRNSQMARRGGGSHLGSTMKLFASLGLSPADLDALAQIPEENISVETLPHILMQLKSRKGDAGDRHMASRDLPSMSPETSYRGGREDWDDMHGGRMGGPSMGQSSARGPSQANYGYGSMQSANSSRGYDFGYGGNNGGGGGSGRDGQYSDLSRRDSYGGHGMGSSQSDFMQRRMGSPSQGKVQDFLGATPTMFPHVCALCDFDVHSNMEWNQHTNGLRHAENRKHLLQMYPDWDPGMAQNTSGGGGHHMDTPNLSAGLLGPIPMSQSHSAGGMPSSWGKHCSLEQVNHPRITQNRSAIMSRVVVAKYDRKPLSKSLIALTEPFGTLREHLVLKNKAFLEMDSHQEAMDMVNYYKKHTANMNGRPLTFYLSKDLMVIEKKNRGAAPMARSPREVKGQGSQVVFFSNLPREEDKKMELLTIAGRFGTVEKHLFLNEEAFVQLGTQEDAEMMVKYYSVNPLNIRGRPIRLNVCTKYKTLSVNQRGGHLYRGESRGRRSGDDYTPPSKSPSKSSSSKTTSSSSKSREEKKKLESKQQTVERKTKVEDKEEVEEAEGVLAGEEGGEEVDQSKGKEQKDLKKKKVEESAEQSSAPEEEQEEENEEGSKQLPTEVQKASGEELPDADSAPDGKDVSEEEEKEAEDEKGEDREMESQGGPGEDLESRDDAPAETSDMTEDLPEDMEDSMDQDFPENMEDFVTLDELVEDEDDHSEHSDSIDNSRKGGMRVVNLVGFRRGYGFLGELLALAKPFGDVVKHLVLDLRPEAYLQFASEEEAKAMARFYNSNVTATVCGKPVRISHSQTYPTIQCGASKVVYVGQLPNTKYKEEDVLKLAESFGKVRKYFLNRIRKECFIEMENAKDAEKMSDFYKKDPPTMQNKRLSVYVSRKYKQLKYGHRKPMQDGVKRPAKRESSSTSTSSTTSTKTSKNTEEPPSKKPKEEEEEEEAEEVEKEDEEEVEKIEESSTEESAELTQPQAGAEPPTMGTEEAKEIPDQKTTEAKCEEVEGEVEVSASAAGKASQAEGPTPEPQPPAEAKPTSASLPLAPYNPENPLGVEYVKMGYYCRVCFLFYSNEDTAKKVHCSSQAHYDKLKKHLEKEQAKAQNPKKGRKTE